MKKTWFLAVFLIAGLSSSAYATQYEFTTIDVPGALWTSANGINNLGHVVGTYSDGNGSHGFIYDGTGYLTIDYPGGNPGNTGIKDINDSGKMVGEYNDGHKWQDFILDNGGFSTYSFPGKTETSINGLNDAGVAAGGYYDWPTNSSNGVLYDKEPVVFPKTTIFSDVNDSGQMVGYDPDFWVSYLYEGGSLNQIVFGDSPSGLDIWALGINDSGHVVGSYMEGGFLFDSASGRVITINYPGAAYSGLSGINDLGYLVGSYTSTDDRGYGFLAVPVNSKRAVPEPSPLVLFGFAAAAICSGRLLMGRAGELTS